MSTILVLITQMYAIWSLSKFNVMTDDLRMSRWLGSWYWSSLYQVFSYTVTTIQTHWPDFMQWVSEWLLFNAKWAIILAISWREQVTWWWWYIRLILDQHAQLESYSASSPKQQSVRRHVASLRHIILIPSLRVFVLTP